MNLNILKVGAWFFFISPPFSNANIKSETAKEAAIPKGKALSAVSVNTQRTTTRVPYTTSNSFVVQWGPNLKCEEVNKKQYADCKKIAEEVLSLGNQFNAIDLEKESRKVYTSEYLSLRDFANRADAELVPLRAKYEDECARAETSERCNDQAIEINKKAAVRENLTTRLNFMTKSPSRFLLSYSGLLDKQKAAELKYKSCVEQAKVYDQKCQDALVNVVDEFMIESQGKTLGQKARVFSFRYFGQKIENSEIKISDNAGSKFTDERILQLRVFPCRQLPSFESQAESVIVTLCNGEKVVFEKASGKIIEGVLQEVSNPTLGEMPVIKYTGKDVLMSSVRRFDQESEIVPGHVIFGDRACKIDRRDLLWKKDGPVNFSTAAELQIFLAKKKNCANTLADPQK